ncbi:unnamed protein product [Symbiodinium pilosum]|uniref:Uncharacterized protein n=1 Tax=Symbiodinium pilosum TaxID=2952 RepID=A0A812XHE3_SYMPI|nr:unnamed protein product [Symbiodinium pilosum]
MAWPRRKDRRRPGALVAALIFGTFAGQLAETFVAQRNEAQAKGRTEAFHLAGAPILAMPQAAKAASESGLAELFSGLSDSGDGEGSYIKWGLSQQIFAAVFFVLFPFGTLYLIFSGRLGWWNYDEDGKELTAEEYRKANNAEKPTWGRFPWELESDLYKK